MGLCYKCAGKWSKDHKCPPEVLLVVETLWDSLLSEDAETDEPKTDEAPPTEEVLVMAISKAAVPTSSATRTV
jgi:hypothetical protein